MANRAVLMGRAHNCKCNVQNLAGQPDPLLLAELDFQHGEIKHSCQTEDKFKNESSPGMRYV